MIDSLSKKLDVPDGIYLKIQNKLIKKLDQLRLIFCVFSSYPLGIINYYIKSPTLRLWYGLITGIILQYAMYGNGKSHSLSNTILPLFLFIFKN